MKCYARFESRSRALTVSGTRFSWQNFWRNSRRLREASIPKIASRERNKTETVSVSMLV